MAASPQWSRRNVLVVGAAAGALALAGPLGSVAAAAGTGGGTVGLRRDHWTPLIGTKVGVDAPEGRVWVDVVDVEDLIGAPAGAMGCFAVELRTRKGRAVDGLLPFTLPRRGVATLRVTAVDRGIRHRSSQIIVNRPGR